MRVLQLAAKLPFFDFGGTFDQKDAEDVERGFDASTWAWLPGVHQLAQLSSDIANQVLSLTIMSSWPWFGLVDARHGGVASFAFQL